ncbi:MAG TPA: hypothetical protein VG435_09760 [Acidimicrobiales bacterium]|jgi:hypothetical protein|nr:hypothetical protein [Acidimicrobiales bacterium]
MSDTSDSDSSGGFWDGVEEFGEGALHYAEEGAQDVADVAEDTPGVGAVISVGETVYHGGAAIYDGATGDWQGAADNSAHMSEDAINVATGGVTGMVEGVYDVGNAVTGGDDSTSAHGAIMDATNAAGNWLGDEAYDLTHSDGSQ